MDEMLKIRLRALSDTEAERYFALCHDAFQLSLCVSVECGRLITVLFRGRGLARLHGNPGSGPSPCPPHRRRQLS